MTFAGEPASTTLFSLPAGRTLVLGVLLLGLFSACDSGGSSDPETLSGAWQGTLEKESVTYQLSLTLQQSSTAGLSGYSLSGTGQLSRDDTTWTIDSSTGSYTEPDLSLSIQFANARPAQLSGTVSEDLETIDAEVNGGPVSFDAASVTLTK